MVRRGPKLRGPTTEKDIKIFENLCAMQCTLEELSSAFSVDKTTLIKRIEEHYDEKFSTIFKQKRQNGTISLRRAQWQTAIDKHSVAMQIFLGKQYLGQMDKQEELTSLKSIIYSTQIGPGGEILTEIKNRDDWDKQKNFDAKKLLIEDQDKKTKKKSKKTKKKS